MSGIEKLNLNLLRVFTAVYETGNVTRASEQLGMSQPAVSGGLARMSEQLGQTLFERTPKGVRPTRAAERLFQPVKDALHAFSSGLIDLPEAQESVAHRHFRIALQNLAEPTVFGPAMDRLARELPNVTIEAVPPFALPLQEELLAGTLDLAFYIGHGCPFEHPDLIIREAKGTHWVCITRRGWTETFGPLTPESMAKAGRVVLDIERIDDNVPILADQSHVPLRPRCTVGRGWSVPKIVAETDLVGAVPLIYAAGLPDSFGLELHPIPYPYEPVPLYVMMHKRSLDDTIHQQMMMILISSGAEMRARIYERWPHLAGDG